MKPRYLTFDCYGTLIDWKTGIEISLRKTFGGLPMSGQALLEAYLKAEKEEETDYKKYREVLSNAAMSLSGSFGFKAERSSADSFAESVPTWPAFPDAKETLKELGRMGYERYILSNVDTYLLEQTIERNGLEVDGYVTAEEVGSYKPNPGHWLTFMEKTGASKAEILHVAQSVFHDIIPTQKMSMASAWVNRYKDPLPTAAQPLYIVESLKDLKEVLGAAEMEEAG